MKKTAATYQDFDLEATSIGDTTIYHCLSWREAQELAKRIKVRAVRELMNTGIRRKVAEDCVESATQVDGQHVIHRRVKVG